MYSLAVVLCVARSTTSKNIDKILIYVKFMFSKKATKIDKIFTINLTLLKQFHGKHFLFKHLLTVHTFGILTGGVYFFKTFFR